MLQAVISPLLKYQKFMIYKQSCLFVMLHAIYIMELNVSTLLQLLKVLKGFKKNFRYLVHNLCSAMFCYNI